MSTLRAGAARANITPPLGCAMAGYFNQRFAEDVADELQASAVVLTDDDTAVAICILDIITADRDDLAIAKSRASELTGIPVENIFISCTHTHSGPSTLEHFNSPREQEYMHWAMERAGDAINRAWNRLVEAEAGHASGACPQETHNRRWHMKDGTVRMNPGYQNPDAVKPAGPTDPEVGLLVVRDLDARPIAAVANYSLHYVGGPYDTSISADYFGYFARGLERMAGAPFVAMMANGFCGDINNCDFTRPAPPMPHPFYQAERVGNRVAAAAYHAWQGIRDFSRTPRLGAAAAEVTFTRREPTAEELAAAQQYRSAKTDPDDSDWVYAGELLAVAQEPLERLTPIQALRVGDLGICGLPGEIFAEYGLQIKQRSPFSRTLTVELANDYIGYCPTDKALAEGSYETRLARTSKAAAGTEGLFVDTCVDLLNRLAD